MAEDADKVYIGKALSSKIPVVFTFYGRTAFHHIVLRIPTYQFSTDEKNGAYLLDPLASERDAV